MECLIAKKLSGKSILIKKQPTKLGELFHLNRSDRQKDGQLQLKSLNPPSFLLSKHKKKNEHHLSATPLSFYHQLRLNLAGPPELMGIPWSVFCSPLCRRSPSPADFSTSYITIRFDFLPFLKDQFSAALGIIHASPRQLAIFSPCWRPRE